MSDCCRLVREVEVNLLAADILFFFDLVKNPYLEPIRGNAVMSLMPFLSSFALDSSEYLKNKGIAGDKFLKPHEKLLLTSRLRLKPLEVRNKPFNEVLDEIDYLVEIGKYWFIGNCPLPLRMLRKLLQSDVGVQFIGKEVFCTTHVSSLNLGVTQEVIEKRSLDLSNISKFVLDTSTDIGRYTVSLSELIGVPLDMNTEYPQTEVPVLRCNNYFSRKLYPQFSAAVSERHAVCVLLTAVISQVNFARLLLPYVTVDNGLALFKMRFLSLYHAILTLDKLMRAQSQRKVLQATAVQQVKKALSSSAVRSIRKYRLLRNALIHYGLQDREAHLLSEELILHGFVEAHAKGRSLQTVNDEIVVGLDHVSHSLSALLPKGLIPKHDFD